MANQRTGSGHKLVFGGPCGLGTLHIDVEAFFEFSFWLADELEDLVVTSKASRVLRLSRHLADHHRPPGCSVFPMLDKRL